MEFLRSPEVVPEMMYPCKVRFITAVCNELAIAVAEETEVDKRTAVRMYDRLWSNITRRRDEVLARGFRAMAPGMGEEVHGTTDRNWSSFRACTGSR